ncbi:MAG: MarR family transcriptional regulator [Chloroflexi bacterium]|nr:MarR family transcriptional regulator [Chloroflexota bacterium]
MGKNTRNNKNFKLDTYTRNIFVLFDQTRDTLIRAVELELKQSKTNFAQCHILYVLTQKKKGMTQGDLSKWLLRNLNTVSTLINKMEKEGVVKKTKNKEDGKVYITLTQKGSEVWDQVTERAIFLTFSALSEEEKEQFKVLLEKLRTGARNILGLDFKPPFLP